MVIVSHFQIMNMSCPNMDVSIAVYTFKNKGVRKTFGPWYFNHFCNNKRNNHFSPHSSYHVLITVMRKTKMVYQSKGSLGNNKTKFFSGATLANLFLCLILLIFFPIIFYILCKVRTQGTNLVLLYTPSTTHISYL